MRVFYCRDNNFGDELNEYVVRKYIGTTFEYTEDLTRPYFLLVGSLFHKRYITHNAHVCGIGIGSRYEMFNRPQRIHLVRGPLTRQRCLELGYDCPEAYGDPAFLLPSMYTPKSCPIYDVVFMPHKIDYENVVKYLARNRPSFTYRVVNLATADIETVLDQMQEGRTIVSSSLHGIIVAHAYRKPCIWTTTFAPLCGDGVKYLDYYASVGIDDIQPRTYDLSCLLQPYPQPTTAVDDRIAEVHQVYKNVFSSYNECSHQVSNSWTT